LFTTETRRSEETVFWLLTSDLTPCSPCLRGEWFEFGFGILFILFFLSKFLGIFYPQMTQIYTDKHTPADWHLCSSVNLWIIMVWIKKKKVTQRAQRTTEI